jgi:hypothetical protein
MLEQDSATKWQDVLQVVGQQQVPVSDSAEADSTVSPDNDADDLVSFKL